MFRSFLFFSDSFYKIDILDWYFLSFGFKYRYNFKMETVFNNILDAALLKKYF